MTASPAGLVIVNDFDSALMFEVLDLAFVLFRGFTRVESA